MPAPNLSAYLIVAAIAAVLTFASTPLMRRLSVRLGAVANPDERHVHEEPTPRGGGAAMLVGVVGAVVAAFFIGNLDEVVAGARWEILGVVAGAALIWGVGFIDDVREVPAVAKIAGVMAAGALVAVAGVSLMVFRFPFLDLWHLSTNLSVLVSILWVLVMATAVNLIDGLDGLAAGIVAIASATFLLYALRLSDAEVISPSNPGALWACIALGVCLGFLPHNVHPAKVFMGDGGALLLGLLMAASTISVGGSDTQDFSGQSFFFFAPIFITLVILGVPMVDTLYAIVRRAARRSALHAGDKEHLHHQLMKIGHGHWRAVLILWMWTALLSAFVLYPTYTGSGDAIVPIGIAGLALALYTLLPLRWRQKRKSQRR